jgi:hypothetical protein
LLAHGRWFSPGTPDSSTTKTGRHDIAEILLKVALNTKIQIHSYMVDHGFNPWSGQIKNYRIGICCFSIKHATLRSWSEDWLSQNKDNLTFK